MNKLVAIVLTVSTLLFGGCAATVQRPAGAVAEPGLQVPAAASKRLALLVKPSPAMERSQDWELFRTEWRTAVAAAAAAAGKQFDYLEAEPAAFTEQATLVVVVVKDYRYLSPGARYGLGILTGNAFIDAEAVFYELPARRALGSRKYATSSTAWQGVFSAMTDKQIQAIAAEMVSELDRR